MCWKDLFYKPLKIAAKPENVLYWGCLHANHDPIHWSEPIWHRRGYKSALEQHKGLIDNWNKKANDNTIGFLLGDIMFGQGRAKEFWSILRQLKFYDLYVMSGNHFAGFHQAFKENPENYNYIDSNLDKKVIFVPNYLELIVNGQPVVCSHYPILSWNGQSKGSIHLYSHVHGNLNKSELGLLYKNTCKRAIEVSVEEQPFPINFNEVLDKVKGQPFYSPDHHDSKTQNPF